MPYWLLLWPLSWILWWVKESILRALCWPSRSWPNPTSRGDMITKIQIATSHTASRSLAALTLTSALTPSQLPLSSTHSVSISTLAASQLPSHKVKVFQMIRVSLQFSCWPGIDFIHYYHLLCLWVRPYLGLAFIPQHSAFFKHVCCWENKQE